MRDSGVGEEGEREGKGEGGFGEILRDEGGEL